MRQLPPLAPFVIGWLLVVAAASIVWIVEATTGALQGDATLALLCFVVVWATLLGTVYLSESR